MSVSTIKSKVLSLIDSEYEKDEMIRQDEPPLDLIDDIDISISSEEKNEEEVVVLIEKIIQKSVKTDHPYFMNQMYGTQNPVAVYGDLLTTVLNTSMYTYEVAPMMTLIEKKCVSKLCGYVWGDDRGDGVFTPGGSISNMKALLLARNSKLKNVKKTGLYDAPKFSIFISDQAHYSFMKGAIFMGFGSDSMVKVKTNNKGQVVVDDLIAAIKLEKEKGRTPLMVVGVAGTTFSGVFDDIVRLGEIAKANDMWYHVDAVYGGSLMFSDEEKHKFKGIEVADSVSWNLHKVMGIPLVCASFLTKEKGLLNEAFAVDADYLFHEDEEDFDLGQKSIQCGRRVDALKLWLAWQHDGEKGFKNRIDNLMKVASTFAEQVKGEEDFELLTEPQSPVVIFRITKIDFTIEELNELNQKVRTEIFKNGKILFNYSIFKGKTYLRFVFSDPEIEADDTMHILNRINEITAEVVEKYYPISSVANG